MRPGRLNLGSVTVEPDLSNAGPFLAAALVTGGTITIPDWPRDSLQAAGQILDVLGQMGARHSVGPDGLTISGTGRIHGVTADLRDVSELAPVLTAAAAVAESAVGLHRAGAHPRRTRRTGWPRWPRRSTRSAATSPSCPTGCRSGRARCGPRQRTDRSVPMTTTGW